MGLDMYLELKKERYVSKGDEEFKWPTELSEVPNTGYGISKSELYIVAYWRKSNAVHKWFVDTCGDGVDECQEIRVSITQLTELYNICLQLLVAKMKGPEEGSKTASELLPTESGFFFGSTEYDEWYWNDIQNTVDQLKPIIKFFEDKEASKSYEIIYQASW